MAWEIVLGIIIGTVVAAIGLYIVERWKIRLISIMFRDFRKSTNRRSSLL